VKVGPFYFCHQTDCSQLAVDVALKQFLAARVNGDITLHSSFKRFSNCIFTISTIKPFQFSGPESGCDAIGLPS